MTIATLPLPTSAAPATGRSALYLIAWTGGFDDDSFQSFTDPDAAEETYNAWVKQAENSSDRISMIEQVIHADGTVINTRVAHYSPAWGDADD